jgi:hypothetical protein
LEYVSDQRGAAHTRYVALRPLTDHDIIEAQTRFVSNEVFSFQKIDLRPEADTLYRNFHESCVRRKIKRAERENLVYECGRSEVLLEKFRYLLLLTRRRHRLPPQPAAWFRNIAHSLGEMMTIHMVSRDNVPVASILTLRYKNSLVYKYGCSDARLNNLGGTPLLFWKVIQQAKASGAEEFDLGRSDYDDPGLIAFKGHLGAVSSELKYYRSPGPRGNKKPSDPGAYSWARQALTRLPDPLLAGIGELVYRHLG